MTKNSLSIFFQNKNILFLWAFHFISLFGSEMTRFVIPIWVFQNVQDISTFSILYSMSILPRILFSVIAGSIIDQINQKIVLVISCICIILTSFIIMMTMSDITSFNFYLLCLLIFIIGFFSNVIHIATVSYIPKLVSKDHFQQCNSIIIGTESAVIILSPLIAGLLTFNFNMSSVIFMDICLVALSLTMLIRINEIEKNKIDLNAREILSGIISNLQNGYQFIQCNQRLLYLLSINTLINFLFSFSFVVFIPFVLTAMNENTVLLGVINSFGGVGQLLGALLAGSLLKSISKIHLIFRSIIILGLFGPFLIGLNLSPVFWGIGYAITLGLIAIINTTNHALWQTYSPLNLQASIFGIRRTISSIIAPVGMLLAPLGLDYIFIPLQPSFITNKYQSIFLVTGVLISLTGSIGYYKLKKITNFTKIQSNE